MQFRVPQNIAMEDRLVGPLTAIQFSILVLGGFLTFFVFTSSLPGIIREIGAAILAMLTVVLALGKFNDQPMYRFFRYVIAFAVRPKMRVWHKEGKETQLVRPVNHASDGDAKAAPKKLSRGDIARLAALVDSRGKSGTPVSPQRHE